MKAIEVMGTVNEQGQLSLDQPLSVERNSRVRVIVLLSDEENEGFSAESFCTSWKQAMRSETLPLSQLWEV
ncbi:MAG TPA: hypothetical protein V6C65_32505 [Allocoleopsis sp.]